MTICFVSDWTGNVEAVREVEGGQTPGGTADLKGRHTYGTNANLNPSPKTLPFWYSECSWLCAMKNETLTGWA